MLCAKEVYAIYDAKQEQLKVQMREDTEKLVEHVGKEIEETARKSYCYPRASIELFLSESGNYNYRDTLIDFEYFTKLFEKQCYIVTLDEIFDNHYRATVSAEPPFPCLED